MKVTKVVFFNKKIIHQEKLIMNSLQAKCLKYVKKDNFQDILKSLKVSPSGFNSARTDDASFSNVRTLADASSCKAANKSTI